MAQHSKYDELHDRYQEIRTTKKGTRYERLAAVVFAALDQANIVIHDLNVIGADSGVAHQIDVHIEQNSRKRRILVECKDFDVSGDSVGLGIARDFWGVVDDVHPDEAWIITCNAFTDGAKRYAKSKGIKLATLRAFADSDWINRIHTIVTNIIFRRTHLDQLSMNLDGANDPAQLAADFGKLPVPMSANNDPTQIFDGSSVRSMTRIASDISNNALTAGTTTVSEKKTFDGWISLGGQTRYPITSYAISVPVTVTAFQITIKAEQGAARLLLVDDDGLDFVLWDTALEAYTIDETGQVHLASDAVQKRLITTISPIPLPDQ